MSPAASRSRLLTAALVLAAGAAAGASLAATLEVSQKRRAFEPREATIARGDRMTFLNDDGELLHHVYVADPRFSFDTGEQQAGTSVAVAFPIAGTFRVMCRIHPRMLMTVTVR